jgi:hypothetical protein
MKNSKFIILLLCLSIQLLSQTASKSDSIKIWRESVKEALKTVKEENTNVSLIKLLATPEKFHAQNIQVVGYLSLDFEGNAIYLHKEDYDHNMDANGFCIQFSDQIKKNKKLASYDGKYVIIIGTFDMYARGHMGGFSGCLKNICRVDFWNF